jgi:hypothetical protein
LSDRKPSPEERAARLEALLDDIQDEPAESDDTEDESSPDLDELDAAWGEDEEEDRERTVIGAVPELVAQTRPDAGAARAVAVAAQKAPNPVRERVDPQVLAERANRRRDKARAKAEAARERKRAKADVVAKKQKQKQPRAKRAPDLMAKKGGESVTEAGSSADAEASPPMHHIPTGRRGRDVARMALLVSAVVIAGGALLFLLRR